MSLTLLIVFITAVLAGLGFWFYNRRQINSLTETLEDKNAVINSFREHLSEPVQETVLNVTHTSTVTTDPESVTEVKTEKKKKRYNNRPKKNSGQVETKQQPNQKQNSEKKNRPNKPRKPKTQQ